MKKLIILLSFCLFILPNVICQTDSVPPDYVLCSRKCLKCHGTNTYSYINADINKLIERRMSPYHFIDSTEFYNSNHKGFCCTDCHSPEYETFPHSDQLIISLKMNCLDCHEGDETTAKYHFEEATKAFQESVHYKRNKTKFTCSSCHNIHTYKFQDENVKNIKQKIQYDNGICIKCHADKNYINFYKNDLTKDFDLIHTWLPNQELHFKNVRCIDCHTKQRENTDSLTISHIILPKEQAVKNCVSCHSQNSILLQSLYKMSTYNNNLQENGFVNGIMLKNSYIIGATKNKFLEEISIILIVLTALGILIHGFIFHILKK